MENLQTISDLAQQRAASEQFSYTGALTPKEAFHLLQENPDVILVDVRSKAELDLVGRVPGATHVEWAFYPGMISNSEFAAQLAQQVNKDLLVIFMCRTGGRSHNAATLAATLGYTRAYNMLEGFEGEANALKQRTLINGWKHAGLTWTN